MAAEVDTAFVGKRLGRERDGGAVQCSWDGWPVEQGSTGYWDSWCPRWRIHERLPIFDAIQGRRGGTRLER